MGLLETEILELRGMASSVLSGEMSPEMAASQLAIFNQVAKREQMLINIVALSAKHGNKVWGKIIRSNLIGDGVAIDTRAENNNKIVCQEKGGLLIDIDNCLDFSGNQANSVNCQKCPHFEKTRKSVFNNE